MKLFLSSLLFLLTFSLSAQAPVAVPVSKEPHHHLILENDYVRVFRVSVPAHHATLLHQHDLPYIYVSLGSADVINAVAGKPEAHLVMTDSQVGYSPGHFAHIARNESDFPFNNVTIELLHPQGEPKNICGQVLLGAPLGECPKSLTWASTRREPLLETAETSLDLVKLDPSLNVLSIRLPGTLIVFLGETQIQDESINAPMKNVAKGDVIWVAAGSAEMIWNSKKEDLSFLLLTFSPAESLAKP